MNEIKSYGLGAKQTPKEMEYCLSVVHGERKKAIQRHLKTLEGELADSKRREVELQEAVNQAVGMANDHAAELLELAASDARLREALKACRKWVNAPHPETAAGSINKPRFDADMQFVADALAESPAQSIAAITAPLEARIAELRGAIEPFATGGVVDCLAREDYSVMRERIVDWHGPTDYIKARDTFARTPAQSLQTIQDAYWKKLHAAMMDLITLRCINSRSAIADFVLDLQNLHEYVDDAAQMARRANNGKTWEEELRAADAQEIESLKERVKTLEDALKYISDTTFNQSIQLLVAQALAAKEPKA